MSVNFLKNQSLVLTKKSTKIKAAFLEWSNTFTAQCYPKIFQNNSNKCLQLTWSLIFILFSCLTCWFVILGIVDYLEYEVVTKIRIHTGKEIVFPLITLCNANPFTSNKSNHLLKSMQDEGQLNYFSDNNNRWTGYTSYAMNKAFSFSDEKKQELGFSISQSLKECLFYSKPCMASDFTWRFNYRYGNCFQFDPHKVVKHAHLSENMYGIYMTLGYLENKNEYPGYPSDGLKIFIHNGTEFGSNDVEIFMETGKQMKIDLSKTLTYRQPSPYSDCQDLSSFKSEIYDYIKSSNNGQYRQKICFNLCFQRFIIEKCQCFSTFYSIFNNEFTKQIKPCYDSNQIKCTNNMIANYSNNIEETCANECPLECEYITYETAMSQLDYPNRQHFDDLKKRFKEYENMSIDEYKKTHLRLNIHFKSNDYAEIREMPKTSAIELISNLGGVLGIFLGLSIFSFVEVFEILLRIAIIVLKK
jgi:hypothetical protein